MNPLETELPTQDMTKIRPTDFSPCLMDLKSWIYDLFHEIESRPDTVNEVNNLWKDKSQALGETYYYCFGRILYNIT